MQSPNYRTEINTVNILCINYYQEWRSVFVKDAFRSSAQQVESHVQVFNMSAKRRRCRRLGSAGTPASVLNFKYYTIT